METCDRNGNCIDDMPTYAQEQLADIERREAVDHPDYYVNRPRRAQDLKKAEWYLSREIKRRERR